MHCDDSESGKMEIKVFSKRSTLQKAPISNAKVSVIVVTYHSREYIERCLSSIFDSNKEASLEVIVVDNASNDGTVELVQATYPSVRILRNKYNYGFATANNQGFDVSTGDYVVALNPDATLLQPGFEAAVRLMEEDPTIGVVAPCTVTAAKGVVALYDGYKFFSPSKVLTKVGISRWGQYSELPSEPKRVSWIWGTGYLCRRAALGRRFFDDATFLFAEEQELCTRVREANYSIVVSPDFLIEHVRSASYGFDKEKSAIARKLLEAACWRHRVRRFGAFGAGLHQALRGLDDGLMYLSLALKKRLAPPNTGRELEMANLWASLSASAGLLLHGEEIFLSINEEARRFFNNGVEVPFPPEYEEFLRR